MGLPRCSRLVCWCSTATLPLPHNCSKIHTRGTNIRHSGVQASSPHSSHSHTHGPHCPRHEQTHMRFKRHFSYRMRQSTVSNRHAPLGNPAMDENHKTFVDKAASYHKFTHAHPTALYPAPYAPSPRRPTPASPPRVVIPNPPTILLPQIPIKSQDKLIACHTRYRLPTMDRSPSRVNKTNDTVPIVRCTRSQTAALASFITPTQAAQQRYPADFLQRLAIPVLDKTSGQSLQYR